MNQDCRKAYEKTVEAVIKPEAQGEFLRVGSPHWLDFKQGWLAHERYLREKVQ